MTSRRLHARSLCADMVTIEWIDEFGQAASAAALLEDISPRGACLNLERPVPAGIPATVRQGAFWNMECRVAYCNLREIGYFVGLEFEKSTDWSKGNFLPQHLLDLGDFLQDAGG